MLVEVWHDFSEVGFVEVSRDDGGSVRVFVDVAAELVVEFGQSQASICLRWNIDGSNDGAPKSRILETTLNYYNRLHQRFSLRSPCSAQGD